MLDQGSNPPPRLRPRYKWQFLCRIAADVTEGRAKYRTAENSPDQFAGHGLEKDNPRQRRPLDAIQGLTEHNSTARRGL